MAGVRRAIRVLPGGVPSPRRRQPPLAAGYEHFRLERQGALPSAKTLDYYNGMVLPFLKWLDAEGVHRFDHLDGSHVRLYRAQLATRPGRWGRTLAPKTLLESHRAILCFLRWARREGYRVDGRILELTAARVPDKEPTIYHIAQVRKVFAVCNPAVPTEDDLGSRRRWIGLRCAQVSACMPTHSGTHSQRWRRKWAGTSSTYVRRWDTRTTECCSAMCAWLLSATWVRERTAGADRKQPCDGMVIRMGPRLLARHPGMSRPTEGAL